MHAGAYTLIALALLVASAYAVPAFVSGYGHIYETNFDQATGQLKKVGVFPGTQQASAVVYNKLHKVLYAVAESDSYMNKTGTGGIQAYEIGENTTIKISDVFSGGGSPAHIGIDKNSRWLVLANYDGGNYGVWSLNSSGGIASKPTAFEADSGSGPNKDRQTGPHPHEFKLSPNQQYAVIPDLGIDKYMIYQFDTRNGKLTANPSQPFYEMPPGSGPRHIVFHPKLNFAYGITELTSKIFAFEFEPTTGKLTLIKTYSACCDSQPPQPNITTGAEVQISDDGLFLYSSVRYLNGTNGTLAIFSVKQDGSLEFKQYESSLGLVPRYFRLDPTENFLLVAHQLSNNVVVFARDKQSGLLSKPQIFGGYETPTWIEFAI